MKRVNKLLILFLFFFANNLLAMEHKKTQNQDLDLFQFQNNPSLLIRLCAKKLAGRLASDLINQRDYTNWLDLQKVPEILHDHILLALCKYHSNIVWQYLSNSIIVKRLTEYAGYLTNYHSLSLSSDDRFISALGFAHDEIWDLKKGTLLFQDKKIRSAAVSLDSKIIAIVFNDNSIQIFDTELSKFLPISQHIPESQNISIYAIAISADNKLIISGNTNGTIEIFDIQTGNCLKSNATPLSFSNRKLITSIFINRENKFIIIFSGSQDFTIWNLEQDFCVKRLEKGDLRAFNLGNLGSDAKLIEISCGGYCSGKFILQNSTENLPMKKIEEVTVTCAAISSNKKFLAFGLCNGRVKTLNIETQECTTLGLFDYSPIRDSELKDNEVMGVWHIGGVRSVTFSSDNKLVISASSDNTIKLWNLKNGQLIKTLAGDSDDILNTLSSEHYSFNIDLSGIFSAVIGQNNNIIVAGLKDGVIKIWQIDTSKGLLAILQEIQQNISKK